MKRALVLLSLAVPLSLLILFALDPALDGTFRSPLFHFYIVTFTTFASAVVAILTLITLGDSGAPRHTLMATAFAAMGGIFLLHGAATPGALILGSHPAVSWSAWLTLFTGAALFALAALDHPDRPSRRLRSRAIVGFVIGAYGMYVLLIAFTPDVLATIDERAGPIHRNLLFILTLALWFVATARLWQTWRKTRARVDAATALTSAWLTLSTISLHLFPVWHLSWWLYHILLLAGFLTVTVALVAEYEQFRRFRLTRYYAAISLVATAAFALLAADLFTRSTYASLVAGAKSRSLSVAHNVSANIVRDLPGAETAGDLHVTADALAARLQGLDVAAITLYDETGRLIFSTFSETAVSGQASAGSIRAAMANQSIVDIFDPQNPPDDYVPETPMYVVEATVPIRASDAASGLPLGALILVQELDELERVLVETRLAGSLIAGASMAALFFVLLGIVRRADRLITARSDELSRAYADLRAAEAMRDDLTDMIVHDLRTPLTAVTVSLDLMARVADDPAHQNTQRRLLSNARDSTRRIVGLINDLLDVSKLEAGQLHPMRERLAIPDFLRERAAAFTTQAEVDNKQIAVEAPPDLPTGLADPSLVSRVLDNLISNALKYTGSGGRILLSAAPNGRMLRLGVQDDGEGIPAEYIERIFDKFVQVPDDNRARRRGTGLGLTFCKLAIEAHGGSIWAESAPGRGSSFFFTLPIMAAESDGRVGGDA